MATGAAPEPQPSSAAPEEPTFPPFPVPGKPRRLSEDLAAIVQEFQREPVTLRELITQLRGRGHVLLVMLLALPFRTPIPLPGLSTPFGLVIALIGLRLTLGQKPWLPARLLDTALPPKLFVNVLAAARKILRGFELLLRPRLPWLTSSRTLLQLHALPIFLAALLLLLPLPVPFSNLIPAFSILLLSAGLLERDGLFLLAGHLTFACAVGFFGIIAFAGAEGFDALREWRIR
jgi:hypothetical protein